MRTPAFVPLATKGVVKTLEVAEAGALGFDMVLGNTFHLFLSPGHELIARHGGLHRFMRWDRPMITDSGGFQVFSMGHGTVADEIKGRQAQGERAGAILDIAEEGVTFRSYLDGTAALHGARDLDGGPGRARLGHRARVRRVHAVQRHARVHRALDRAHPPLARPLPGLARRARARGQVVYGIVQGGVDEELRRASAQEVAARACGGIAIGGTLGQDKAQMYEVVEWAVDELPEERPRHLLGIGEIDDLLRGVELGIDTFDCAMPTRIGRHGMAIVPDPDARWRIDLAKGRYREADEPILDGCPCPACERGYSRAYLHYLLRAGELTASRLLTLHNLAYIQRLLAELRDAIAEGRLAAAVAASRAGVAPWELGAL